MRRVFHTLLITLSLLSANAQAKMYIEAKEQLTTYATVAQLSYDKAYRTSKNLQQAINALLASPDKNSLMNAQKAWKKAHYYYGQTEALHFPLTIELKERLNQWPIDPSVIDSVTHNTSAGIINESDIPLTADILTERHMQFEEMDITLGFHAIEFVLWGEDLNDGTKRVAKAFSSKHPRRRDYLRIASTVLTNDLKSVAEAWQKGTGSSYAAFTSLPKEEALLLIFNSLTTFSGVTLAGSYIGAPMVSGNQADESSDFSDTTHLDYQAALLGLKNIWLGRYEDYQGTGLSDLVQKIHPDLANLMLQQLIKIESNIAALPTPYDSEILYKYANSYLPIPDSYTHRKQLEKTMQSALKLHVFFWQAMVELGIYQWPKDKERLRYQANARMAD